MKIRTAYLTAAVMLSFALPCSAQLASPVHVVPVIAKTGGVAGTDWVTSLSMSNVSDGVVNLSLSARTFLITTFAANGAEISSERRSVPAFSMSQWSLEQLGVPLLTTPGRVEVMIDPATVTWDPCDQGSGELGEGAGAFLAYMSRVDQATSDAEFGPGQSDWKPYLDLCGEQPGLSVHHLGSLFQSDRGR